MATILDASVMGDLRCEPNATARELTITTNNVIANIDFEVIIIANNSRGSHKRTTIICKFIRVCDSTLCLGLTTPSNKANINELDNILVLASLVRKESLMKL